MLNNLARTALNTGLAAKAVPCAFALSLKSGALIADCTAPMIPLRSGALHCVRHSDPAWHQQAGHPADGDTAANNTILREIKNAKMQ